MTETQAKEYTRQIIKSLEDKKADDIRVIDIRNISVMADYFVIASSKNPLQMNALIDCVDEVMMKNGINAKQVEGSKNSTWVLMDYEDIIVHLFSQEDRLFYNLERIWQDGTEVDIGKF